MRLQVAFSFLALSVTSSLAIFADEVNHIDFHHALLGAPTPQNTFFHRPALSSSASLLYTLSERLVLGAVNPKDGSLVWRQKLGEGRPDDDSHGFLRASDGENTIISAVGGEVSSWGASDGKLSWRDNFKDGPVQDLEILELQDGSTTEGASDVIALLGDKTGIVRRLDGLSGEVKWEYKDDSGDTPFQVSSSSTEVFYISLQSALLKGYKIKVTALNSQTGRQTRQHTLSSENEVTSPESIIFVGRNTASPLIVWADKSFKTLKVNIIGSKQVTSLNIENSSGENIQKVDIRAPECLNCLPHFLVHYETDSTSWAEVYHVDLKSSTISKAYQVPRVAEKSVFATSSKGANVFFTRITNSGISVFSSASHAILGRWDPKLGTVDHAISAVAEVATKGDSAAVRFAYTVDSGDWKLVRNGEVEWIRPESLAGVIAASWADVDLGIDLAHELEIEGHESLLGAYIHRVKRHAKDLQHLPDWLRALPKRIFTSFLTAEVSDLSSFGLAKLAIVATAQGRLIALDTGRNGAVAWNIPASESPHWKVKAITTDLGLATVHVDDGSTVSVNITTGDIVARTTPTAKIGSIVILENGSKLNIGEDGSPLGALTESTHLVTLSPDGRVLGWSAKSSDAPAWQFLPAKGERIIHATSRPAHDPVASIGKVLGDRSVLYKYLNPNLALITAVGETSVTFYLLDGVSGDVLHSVSHAGVDTTQPISSVISENWFAYSIWADATDESEPKGYQLVVSELYESPLPNDRGPLGAASNYSSLQGLNGSPPPRPHVISQSYLIAEPISHMSVTQTAQGITVRQLICVLPESNAIIGIPRMILDPRRPVGRDPTREEAEEGLVKYAPYLDFDGRWYLTHARDVLDIRTTISTPTLLESTSLIFAFGGDVFGTRVTPSQAFDLLGRGFSKLQLVATVVALTAGVAALAPMVRSKQVNLLWKR